MRYRHGVLAGLIMALAGCGGGGVQDLGVSEAGVDGGCPHQVTPGGPGDPDGDGLQTRGEVEGWTVQVDSLGLGSERGHLQVYAVTSDPGCPDADGDGLNDLEEFLAKTDPRKADTDGDGLSDGEELHRWHTSPVSVDTDGDATGMDGLRAPNPSLFDGAELAIGLSPTLADTDGDGACDCTELNDPVRNPRVAELPQAEVAFEGEIDMRLRVAYAEAQGQESEYGTTFGTSTTNTTSRSDTTSVAETVKGAGGFWDDLDVGDGVKGGLKAFGAKKGIELATNAACDGLDHLNDAPPKFDFSDPLGAAQSLSEGITFGTHEASDAIGICAESTPDVTTTRSTTISTESAKQSSESYSNYVRDSRERTETTAGGSVSVGMRIRNSGVSTFQLDSLFVTMAQYRQTPDPNATRGSGAFRTLATLRPQFEDLVLSPGESSPLLQVAADDVDPSIIKQFLARPTSVFYSPANVELLDANGINFEFLTEQTFARTALVVIDFGDGTTERYRVATNVEHDEDGSLSGITLDRVFTDVLQIPYSVSENDAEGGTALLSIRDVTNNVPDDTFDPENPVPVAPSAFWTAFVDAEEQPATSVDFRDIVLRHGDTITLVFQKDEDGDGLTKIEEGVFGTSDTSADLWDSAVGERTPDGIADGIDTDRDGLSDYVEARTGWTVSVSYAGGLFEYRARPSPTLSDADGDTLDDAQERALGTDPNSRDTDDDGLADFEDPAPLSPARIVFVNAAVATPGDGSTWAAALADLQEALTITRTSNTDNDPNNDVARIWVARGRYVPGASTSDSFVLVGGVAVYGGFTGNETRRGQREEDPFTNGTQLSGDLLGDDHGANDPQGVERTDNARSVVMADADIEITALLDGFTISGGHVPDATSSNAYFYGVGGGGLASWSSLLHVRNVAFIQNTSQAGGAACGLNRGGQALFEDCVFLRNAANVRGGAVACDASATFLRCKFIENSASRGMALVAGHPDSTIQTTDCQFVDNFSTQPPDPGVTEEGAAVWANGGKVILDRCHFGGNRGPHRGALHVGYMGGAEGHPSANALVRATNCTLFNNQHGVTGGGFESAGTTHYHGYLYLTGCTVANSWGSGIGTPLLAEGRIQNSVISGSFTIDVWAAPPLRFRIVNSYVGPNPGFVNVAIGDLRLDRTSPCIDIGSGFADIAPDLPGQQPLPSTDKAGKKRIVDGDGDGIALPDAGAYEYKPGP